MVPFPAFPRKGLIMEQFLSYAAAALLVGSFAALQWYGRKYYSMAHAVVNHYKG
jgi:uncharacterized membrane protein